jgi:hypothetical protein
MSDREPDAALFGLTGSEDPIWIFMHLPKTGGNTLTAVLRRRFTGPQCFQFNPDDPGDLQRLARTGGRGVGYIDGHLPFGLHRWLDRPAVYITLLRHPVERLISEYYFIWNYEPHPLHRFLRTGRVTLEEYVEISRANVMTTHLSSSVEGSPMFPTEVAEEHLRIAKENLSRHFAAVGITERFDAFLLIVSRMIGLRLPLYRRRNVTPRACGRIPPELRDRIRRRNRLDLELYDFACDLHDAQFAQQGNAPGVLATFRALTSGVDRADRLWRRVPARMRRALKLWRPQREGS